MGRLIAARHPGVCSRTGRPYCRGTLITKGTKGWEISPLMEDALDLGVAEVSAKLTPKQSSGRRMYDGADDEHRYWYFGEDGAQMDSLYVFSTSGKSERDYLHEHSELSRYIKRGECYYQSPDAAWDDCTRKWTIYYCTDEDAPKARDVLERVTTPTG